MAAEREYEECQYLQAVAGILEKGTLSKNRTGVDTKAVFGMQMRYNLRESFPLLTTKKMFFRGVAEELLWCIRGSTNSKELSDKKVHIWEKFSTRNYLDEKGFTERKEGDLGPVYGFQWRHFGAQYVDMDTDYRGQGTDQLQDIIDTIRTNPSDRRMILSAWNPADLHLMVLPPCPCLVQFHVSEGELSCQVYQRSADMGLGVPFDIATYSLLTCMVAHVTGLKPGDLVHSLGNAHVYVTHEEALREQLARQPRPFPTLRIRRQVDSIDDFTMEDLELEGYNPHPHIHMDLAV